MPWLHKVRKFFIIELGIGRNNQKKGKVKARGQHIEQSTKKFLNEVSGHDRIQGYKRSLFAIPKSKKMKKLRYRVSTAGIFDRGKDPIHS